MNSEFLYLLNVAIAMIGQNLAIKSIKIGERTIELPRLAGADLAGALTVDDAVLCARVFEATNQPECNLVLAQMQQQIEGYGADTPESTTGTTNAGVKTAGAIVDIFNSGIQVVGSVLPSVISAFNTKTVNSNTSNNSSTSASASASLSVYAGVGIGAAILIAVILMRK